MAQQQLLLMVLTTIIVSVAMVAGVNMFNTGALNSERDALVKDVRAVASSAAAYWRKPAGLGGGARSFMGVSNVASFGSDLSNLNGNFIISSIMTNRFILTATGANEGVIVVATITQQGVTGSPLITMP